MNKESNIFIQDKRYIKVLNNGYVAQAFIYSEEQRRKIRQLIRENYFPHHTAIGKGNVTSRRWNVEEYKGRIGQGYRMISSSPYSSKLNHITYFIKLLWRNTLFNTPTTLQPKLKWRRTQKRKPERKQEKG